MIFYDCSTAPNPRRARMFLAEKGLTPETHDISIAKGEQLGDAFRAVNPRATLPVLITDAGTTLTENLAIAMYLEDTHPEPPLIGTTPDERANILQWNAICESQGAMAVAEVLRNSNPHMKDRAIPGPANFEQIPQLAERGRARVTLFKQMLDQHLDTSAYLAGDAFTFADISAFVFSDFARVIKMGVTDETPNLLRWYEAIKARPSAQI